MTRSFRTDEGAHIGPEGETDWHGLYLFENRRAEKAERERDGLRDDLARAEDQIARQAHNAREAQQVIEAMDDTIKTLRAEQLRPLTARENLAALWESAHRPVGGRIPAGTSIITRSDHGNGDVRYQTLEATGRDLPDEGRTLERDAPYGPENGNEYRLLDPPARPDGAEELQALVDEWADGYGAYTPESNGPLVDYLAERGVRVTEDGAA